MAFLLFLRLTGLAPRFGALHAFEGADALTGLFLTGLNCFVGPRVAVAFGRLLAGRSICRVPALRVLGLTPALARRGLRLRIFFLSRLYTSFIIPAAARLYPSTVS